MVSKAQATFNVDRVVDMPYATPTYDGGGLFRFAKFSPIDLKTFTFPDDETRTAYARAATDVTVRDRLQRALLAQSRLICQKHRSETEATALGGNFLLNLGQIGFSAAGTIVGGEFVKSVLSGASTFLGGARAMRSTLRSTTSWTCTTAARSTAG